ncbi:MAG TPA: 3,4-dihydroxy-2-butanone-4-phosphate synthase, partial [Mucilaginibacter sp.]
MHIMLNTIQEAIEDIKAGKMIIVVDDEDRENEGDFLTAARNATPEAINFMVRHGRGLVCAPITADRARELNLEPMVSHNTTSHETNFTVSVDLLGHGCTTGISASDRSKTTLALIDPATRPEDLGRPGHIFPLIAKDGGVLRRSGHTEAAIDLAVLAGFEPAGVICEIMKEDGDMARLHDLEVMAREFNLKIISIKDLIAYRLNAESLVKKEVSVKMPTEWGDFEMIAYTQLDTGENHLALVKGTWEPGEPVLTRVHSSCVTGDIFGSCRCDCGPQLHKAMEMISKEGKGVVVYMNQEGRGIGLI